jgi:glycine C-acetyltransferase
LDGVVTYTNWQSGLQQDLTAIRDGGLWKQEGEITSAQGAHITIAGRDLINMCANNYLGLANHPAVVAAAHEALDVYGFGTASVRFICGTQDIHHALEDEISQFLGTEATILFGSCFDANGGVFEALLNEEDAVISDALNHASIIDGIRLCKAKRFRYANSDMAELERCLQEAQGARRRLIVTDGVFSMDGYIAKLPEICELAERYDALVMVDDSHAVGHLGEHGRGTPELTDTRSRIDLLSGTMGKALGGASGGYISGRQEIVDLLRQRARPYLFSNSVPPSVVEATRAVLQLLKTSDDLRDQLRANTFLFRSLLANADFALLPGDTPIVPVMFGDAVAATSFAARLRDNGVHAVAFSYPVVPLGGARIRTQVSAAHSSDDIRNAVAAFIAARG